MASLLVKLGTSANDAPQPATDISPPSSPLGEKTEAARESCRHRRCTSEYGEVICLPPRMRRTVDFPDPFAPMRRQRLLVRRFKLRLWRIIVNGL